MIKLEIWKAFPFDCEIVPAEYEDFMNQIIQDSYGSDMETFFKNTVFVCDKEDIPIATCSYWKAYRKFNSIHWLKTKKEYEGQGLGRAVAQYRSHKSSKRTFLDSNFFPTLTILWIDYTRYNAAVKNY